MTYLLTAGLLLCAILFIRNFQVFYYRRAVIKMISQASQNDIVNGREWMWRWDSFDTVSYYKMWLLFWRRPDSFFNPSITQP